MRSYWCNWEQEYVKWDDDPEAAAGTMVWVDFCALPPSYEVKPTDLDKLARHMRCTVLVIDSAHRALANLRCLYSVSGPIPPQQWVANQRGRLYMESMQLVEAVNLGAARPYLVVVC